MRAEEAIRALIAHSGLSGRAVSTALGKAHSWAGITAKRTVAPKLQTVADVADVAGVDVVLIDRATGETVGVVEPPRRTAMEQEQES